MFTKPQARAGYRGVVRIVLALVPLLLLALAPGRAEAGTAIFTVRGLNNKPLPGAVVQIVGTRRPIPAAQVKARYTVAQRDIAFQPHVIVVPLGASVSFPNEDAVRHHVYSFSAAKTFELKLYGRQETRVVTFDVPGVVALGCNIHDSMSGFVFVADTPFAAVSDERGQVRFEDVPAGAFSVEVWHPSIRGGRHRLSQTISFAPEGVAMALQLKR